MVLNGLSRAVKLVAPLVFRLFGCICPLCFLMLLFKNSTELRANALFQVFQYNEASTGRGCHQCHPLLQILGPKADP